jgi:zinc protease
VEEYYRKYFRPENTIIAVVGDIDPELAVQNLRSRLESWRGEGEWTAPVVVPVVRQAQARTVNHPYPSQQVRFVLGHAGIVRSNPAFPALRVMETILSDSPGFTNRLARTVRDQMGLAYDVSGTVTTNAGLAAGSFQIVLGVEAKDKETGLSTVMKVLQTFVDEGPTETEVADAKHYLQGSYASSWETVEGVAEYLLNARRYGLGFDDSEKFCAGVAAVTREEVLRVARQYIDVKNLTTIVVGPVDRNGKVTGSGK